MVGKSKELLRTYKSQERSEVEELVISISLGLVLANRLNVISRF